jgi:hypothetical protein
MKVIITYSVVESLDPGRVGRRDFDPGDGSWCRLTDVSIVDEREEDGAYHVGAGLGSHCWEELMLALMWVWIGG